MHQEAPAHRQVSQTHERAWAQALFPNHTDKCVGSRPLPLRYVTVLNCCRIGRKPSHEFLCSIGGKASRLQFIDVVVSPGPVKQTTEEEDGVGATHPVAAEVNP